MIDVETSVEKEKGRTSTGMPDRPGAPERKVYQ
jgi:hypothetical protein